MATATANAASGWSWMAEVAGEELAKLEAAHPGRFGPLKAELRRLVADPGADATLLSVLPRAAATPSSQAGPAPPLLHLSSTQESSTKKRKPPSGGACECEPTDGKRRKGAPGRTKKDRADVAIERAERCLERIRAIKRSLLAAWTHR